MSKLSSASGRWLWSVVSSIGSAIDRTHARTPDVNPPVEIPGVGTLSRDVCALQGLFARARVSFAPTTGAAGDPAPDSTPDATAAEREHMARNETLVPLQQTLHSCRDALAECSPHLSMPCRRRLEDAMRTLETEYVRLCDAERFLAARRLRRLKTGEPDDDLEFTIVLERVVYATDQGDEVAASVAQAVQTIVAGLLPYVARPE